MKYDLVRSEDDKGLEGRLIDSFIRLPTNPWSLQKLSHSNTACVLVAWHCGMDPLSLKVIPRTPEGKEDFFEILRNKELIGSIEIPDDIEVVMHVLRMHKALIELELDFPNVFAGISNMIYCLGNDDISELADEFVRESSFNYQTALEHSRDSWNSFLGEFLNFCPAKDMRLAA
jgi:hypothetical protein